MAREGEVRGGGCRVTAVEYIGHRIRLGHAWVSPRLPAPCENKKQALYQLVHDFTLPGDRMKDSSCIFLQQKVGQINNVL